MANDTIAILILVLKLCNFPNNSHKIDLLLAITKYQYLCGSQAQSGQGDTHSGLALYMCDLHHNYCIWLW